MPWHRITIIILSTMNLPAASGEELTLPTGQAGLKPPSAD